MKRVPTGELRDDPGHPRNMPSDEQFEQARGISRGQSESLLRSRGTSDAADPYRGSEMPQADQAWG